MANAKAEAVVVIDVSVEANATPMAIPSGILCIVIERINIIFLLTDLCLIFLLNNLSAKYNNIVPRINPIDKVSGAFRFNLVDCSIAGLIREKNDAESIIPADKANIDFKILLFTFLKKNTNADPKDVIEKVNKVAIIVCNKGFKLYK